MPNNETGAPEMMPAEMMRAEFTAARERRQRQTVPGRGGKTTTLAEPAIDPSAAAPVAPDLPDATNDERSTGPQIRAARAAVVSRRSQSPGCV